MPSTTMMVRSTRRALRAALLVPALAFAAACGDDDPTEPEPELTFIRVVLTFQPTGGGTAQTVTITRASSAVSAPLVIPASGGTLTARYLNADGTEDQVLAADQESFETRIVATGVTQATFARQGSSPNTFTVTRNAAGTAQVQVQLFHLDSGHEDFEATMTIQVQ